MQLCWLGYGCDVLNVFFCVLPQAGRHGPALCSANKLQVLTLACCLLYLSGSVHSTAPCPPCRRPDVQIPPAKKVFAPANLRAQADNAAYRQLVLQWMDERVRCCRAPGGVAAAVAVSSPGHTPILTASLCCYLLASFGPHPCSHVLTLPELCPHPHLASPSHSTRCATAAAWCPTCTTLWPRWAGRGQLRFAGAEAVWPSAVPRQVHRLWL